MGTKILQTDLARDALYTKVNTIADEKQDVLTFDSTPTSGSNNPVTSDGIKTYVDSGLSSKADNSAVVHLTGDETITGTKTFNGDVFIKNTEYAYNETPSSNSFTSLYIRDKNDLVMGACELVKFTNGDNFIQFNVFGQNGSWASAGLGLGVTSSGVTYTYCPTPAVSANGLDIATTAYVNNKLVKVSTLPASPNSNVYYFIPE